MNLAATMSLSAAGFLGPLSAVRGALASTMGPMLALGGATLSLAAVVQQFRAAIGAAAGMEDFETGFRTLLGSTRAAKDRLKELADFATTTPFELPSVVAASRLLQAFTGDALATGAGLRLVGDAAAAVNQPLEAVTMWMGRLYAALKDGQPLGEPIQNLTQLGLISGETRKTLLALQGQTLSNARVMGVLNDAFGKNAGAMEALSRTYNGKISNLKDSWGALQRAVGAPIRDALKPFLDSAIARLGSLVPTAERIGRSIAGGLSLFRAAWSDGSLGQLVELGLTVAFGNAINVFVAGLLTGTAILGKALSAAVDNLGGIALVMEGAAGVSGAALLQGLTRPLAYIQAAMDKVLDIGSLGAKDLAREDAIKDLRANDPRFQGKTDEQLRIDKRFVGMAGDESIQREVAVGSWDKDFSEAIEARVAKLNTIDERAKKIIAEGGAKFGFGGEAMNASQIMGGAKDLIAEGLGQLREPAAKLGGDIAAIVKQFKVEDITGAGSALEELRKKIAALGPAAASFDPKELQRAVADAIADIYGPKKDVGVGRVADAASDRLSKIGLFVGGAGGPAVDYARRTALATEKMLAKLSAPASSSVPAGAAYV